MSITRAASRAVSSPAGCAPPPHHPGVCWCANPCQIWLNSREGQAELSLPSLRECRGWSRRREPPQSPRGCSRSRSSARTRGFTAHGMQMLLLQPALQGRLLACLPPARLRPHVQQTRRLIKSVNSNHINCIALLVKAELSNHSKYLSGSLEQSPAKALPRPAAGTEVVFPPCTWRGGAPVEKTKVRAWPREADEPRSAFRPPIKPEFSISAN